ncbi:uncharacterized protein BDW70DRAFT_51917 [Aspergillus foveolatus]|uniref:uncharacterized protein n=1 Tax=Aspergillus foveolatus TaxID=210207 RepID=UPI003CCCAC77
MTQSPLQSISRCTSRSPNALAKIIFPSGASPTACSYVLISPLPNDVEHHGEQVKRVCRPRTSTPTVSLGIFEWSVRRFGFRVIFMTEGLATLAVSCLISGPAGSRIRWGVSAEASGLSTLETAAEPYVARGGI